MTHRDTPRDTIRMFGQDVPVVIRENVPRDTIGFLVPTQEWAEPHVEVVELYEPGDPACPVVVVKRMTREEIEEAYPGVVRRGW